MDAYYELIFKRKSMRKFDPALSVNTDELRIIEQKAASLAPLDTGLRKVIRLVDRRQTTCKWGEYCLLYYGGNTERDRLNAGYMLEQMDLFLASMDIGVCWYGLSRPDVKTWDGLSYVIMLTFGKSRPGDFRNDMLKASRQPREAVWQGEFDENVITPAIHAPSACNMQPWRVRSEDHVLHVYRTTDVRSAIMPVFLRPYYNTIDLGIFLCFLEVSLARHGYKFERSLHDAKQKDSADKRLIPIADYTIAE